MVRYVLKLQHRFNNRQLKVSEQRQRGWQSDYRSSFNERKSERQSDHSNPFTGSR